MKLKLVNALIISFVLSCTLNSLAQEDFQFRLFGGPDFNSLAPPSDSIQVGNSVTPFFGLGFIVPTSGINEFHIGATFFMKSSRDDRKILYENIGLSVFGDYYLKITKGVHFTVGPQYSVVMISQIKNGSIKTPMSGYDSYLSLNAGINFQLQEHLSMGLVYEFPVNNPKLNLWPSLKLKIALSLDKDLFNVDEREHKQKHSVTRLREMKETVLLVRLRGYQKQIKAFEEGGNLKRAEYIKQERDRQNAELMAAFKNKFDYCPVYFFYNYDTKKIKNKELNNVFINENLEVDSTIKVDAQDFFVGELGYHNADSIIFERPWEDFDQSYKVIWKRNIYQSTDLSNYGFLIMNSKFEIIPKPFPSYTMGYFMVVKRKPDVIIEKVNKKLKGIKEVKHNHNLQQYQLEQYQRNLELERRIQNNLRR